jgi:hypothetical protein
MYPALATDCSHELARASFGVVIWRDENALLRLYSPLMAASFGNSVGRRKFPSRFHGSDRMCESIVSIFGWVEGIISVKVLDQKRCSFA